MKKIPTVLKRDPDDMRHLLPEVTPGCEWVLAGEGKATRKYDGVCTMRDDEGVWWARREVKPDQSTPVAFQAVAKDDATGKWVGWVPIEQSGHAKWHAEALDARIQRGLGVLAPGTYELCGPRVNRNPERFDHHTLVSHAHASVVALEDWEHTDLTDGDFGGLKTVLLTLGGLGYEGIVWHHEDGRMAKLKAKDFR
jgi:hypothetical protein